MSQSRRSHSRGKGKARDGSLSEILPRGHNKSSTVLAIKVTLPT